MPKKYPVDVRLFVVQARAQGHSWDKISEMVTQTFSLNRCPSQRQMSKWVFKGSVPEDAMGEIKRRLPAFASDWINIQQDNVGKAISESIAGTEPREVWARWIYSQLKWVLGYDAMKAAWVKFAEEEERLANSTIQKTAPPFTQQEERRQQ